MVSNRLHECTLQCILCLNVSVLRHLFSCNILVIISLCLTTGKQTPVFTPRIQFLPKGEQDIGTNADTETNGIRASRRLQNEQRTNESLWVDAELQLWNLQKVSVCTYDWICAYVYVFVSIVLICCCFVFFVNPVCKPNCSHVTMNLSNCFFTSRLTIDFQASWNIKNNWDVEVM